jgi:ankyrin repeat protein
MVKKSIRSLSVALSLVMAASAVFAQAKAIRHERRPAALPESAPASEQKQPTYQYFSILDGMPMGLILHHDTEVGSGKPIDVYMYPIELQVLNSDGNFEPVGLIIDNFYTAKAVDPLTAPNPLNARDCKIWNALVLNAMGNRNPKSPTWSYVEFVVAQGARVIQTNEDGQVFWSDDIECWGSKDRFAPF